MTEKELIEIVNNKIGIVFEKEYNVCQGLNIIRKYCPDSDIEYGEHCVIGSVFISEIVEAGITKEDAIKLRMSSWMIDGKGRLVCFV